MTESFQDVAKQAMSKKTLAKAKVRAKEVIADYYLTELRTKSGKTQAEIAKILGIKQPSLSKLEKQKDMQLSTLRKIVQALGGELEIVAKFPKGRVKIGQFMG